MITVVMKLLIIIHLLVCSSSIIRGWGGKFNKLPNDQDQLIGPRMAKMVSYWPQISQKPSSLKNSAVDVVPNAFTIIYSYIRYMDPCHKRQCTRNEHCCDGTACVDINQGGE